MTEAGGLFVKMPAVISKGCGFQRAHPGEREGQLPRGVMEGPGGGQLGCPHCWGPGSRHTPAGCALIPHRIEHRLSWADPEGSALDGGGWSPWLLASSEVLHPLDVEGLGQGQ